MLARTQQGSSEVEARLKKIIVTGANGVGKSHFANRLGLARPEVPVIPFDAIKLRTNWQQRPRSEIASALQREVDKDAWILEGGPSLLPFAIERADALVWLDPPEFVRAWRLLSRPWRNLGRTRPELPSDNVDWPWQQYKFAIRSLKNRARFHAHISQVFRSADKPEKWRCRDEEDRNTVVIKWAKAMP